MKNQWNGRKFSEAPLAKSSGKSAFLGMNGDAILPVLVKTAIIIGIRLVAVHTEFSQLPLMDCQLQGSQQTGQIS